MSGVDNYKENYTMRKVLSRFLLGTISLFFGFSYAQSEVYIPRHGAYEKLPGKKWEDAFVTANGRMGAMLYGEPGQEVFIANHCRLFLPYGSREIVPDLAQYFPEFRKIYREKGGTKAQNFIVEKAKEQGFPGIIDTDPSHPGFFINIKQPLNGEIKEYSRTEDFRTGEVVTRWKGDNGEFIRRMFVSREKNAIYLYISGPGTCCLEFPALGQELIDDHIEISPEWVGYHNVYTEGKGGYDAGVRILKEGGSAKTLGNVVQIDGAKEIMLIMRIVPWRTPLPKEKSEAWAYSPENPSFKKTGIYNPIPELAESSVVFYLSEKDSKALLPKLKESLEKSDYSYQNDLQNHAKIHSELFDRVSFCLNVGDDYRKTTTELLAESKEKSILPRALMEKMYDAGRYMLICSAGETLPTLQSIWSGSWSPAWSGDYTLDTNVQSAMAAACSGNLTDLMEGYFRTIESFYPDWRLNAGRIYGCRGVLTNARASNTALMLHWERWPGNCWTAGCGWLSSFFTRYVDYTQDMDFFKKRCMPLLKEIALFYEDFLKGTEKNGKVEFIPSYNPETTSGINATMDIAVAKELYTNLIRFSEQLNIEQENVGKWKEMLNKLPAFPINDGVLTEWPDRGVSESHRHHSQLYPCFQSFDPIFEKDTLLRSAAKKLVLLKIEGLDGVNSRRVSQRTAFSRIQNGISAAYLGMAEEAYGRLKILATGHQMNPSLITSHDPNGRIFNTDGNGGIPEIVATMLAFSRTDCVDLLRALPSAWPEGSIKGLNLACGSTVDLKWNNGILTSAIFRAKRDTKFTVSYKGKTKLLKMKKGDIVQLSGEMAVL